MFCDYSLQTCTVFSVDSSNFIDLTADDLVCELDEDDVRRRHYIKNITTQQCI